MSTLPIEHLSQPVRDNWRLGNGSVSTGTNHHVVRHTPNKIIIIILQARIRNGLSRDDFHKNSHE